MILLRVSNPHSGKTDTFMRSDIDAARRIAREVDEWLRDGGSLDEL